MFVLWIGGVGVAYVAEQHGTPAQHAAGVSTRAIAGSTGGNMEGKEQRNGIVNSALWATTTSDTSNGSVNAAMESFTGLGSAVPMSNLGMSDVVWGGVGCGLYGMLVYVLLAVFIGGLDGRAHAGVPRQEDRGQGDQARLARRAADAADDLDDRRRCDREPARARVDRRRAGRRASQRRCTRT